MSNDTDNLNPYTDWLDLPSSDCTDRELLGVTRQATRLTIDEAYHERYSLVRQYQVGKHSATAVKMLEELSKAYHRLISRLSVAAADAMLGGFDDGEAADIHAGNEESEDSHPDETDVSRKATSTEVVDDFVQASKLDSSHKKRKSHRPSSGSYDKHSRRSHRRVYHIRTSDGRREGPLSRRRLKKYANFGLIQADTVVWREGWDAPKMAREMYPELEETSMSLLSNLAPTDLEETTKPATLAESKSSAGVAIVVSAIAVVALIVTLAVAWAQSRPKYDGTELEAINKSVKEYRARKAKEKEAEQARQKGLSKQKNNADGKSDDELIKKFRQNVEQLKGSRRPSSTGTQATTSNHLARKSAALRFSGWQHVEISDSDNLIDLNSNFAVEAWIRWPLSPGIEQVLFDCESPTTDKDSSGWSLRTQPHAAGFKLIFRVATEGDAAHEFESIILNRTGRWRHVAVSRQKEQFLMFVDGVSVGASQIQAKCINPQSNLFIGSPRTSPSTRRFGRSDPIDSRRRFRSLLHRFPTQLVARQGSNHRAVVSTDKRQGHPRHRPQRAGSTRPDPRRRLAAYPVGPSQILANSAT